jgi:GDPmannose 4,6-dehydratase
LLEKGYEVHGAVRQVALEDPAHRLARIRRIQDRLVLHPANLESYPSVFHLFATNRFDECYHLAAQSFVAEGFGDGFSTMSANINGTHFVLAALRATQPACKLYFAGSSEMFGSAAESPQSEQTCFHPRNSYGISKVAGFDLCRSYRETYGMFCACGILFNHESPRRGFEFVTRKITSTAAAIKLGLAGELRLGNLDARRDWGHAADYVRAMHGMLQAGEPGDFVIASGETHSVREFADAAFSHVGLRYEDYVITDERFVRPAEANVLVGDSSRARAALGWAPAYTFEQLVAEMMEADLAALSSGGQGQRPR